MPSNFQVFKKFSSAKKAVSNSCPIIRVGDLYIVGGDDMTHIELIFNGRVATTVLPFHLCRLGNANKIGNGATMPGAFTYKEWVEAASKGIHPETLKKLAEVANA